MKRKFSFNILKNIACSLAMTIAFSSVAFGLPFKTSAVDEEADVYLNGDVIGKNGIDAEDALYIQKSCADLVAIENNAMLAADTNCNGSIEIADVVYLLQWIVTLDTESLVGEYMNMDNSPAVVLEAENGIIEGAVIKTYEQELHNNVYVDFDNCAGSYASYKVRAEKSGTHKLRIYYLNDGNAENKMYIEVNDSHKGVLADFTSHDSQSVWKEEIVLVDLVEGENTIKFISAENTGGPSLFEFSVRRSCMYPDAVSDIPDELLNVAGTSTTASFSETTISITTVQVPPDPTSVRYYAVDAVFYDSWEETLNPGFEGTAYVNYNNAVGSYIEWTVNVSESGNYNVGFRYANGTDADRITRITVNGAKECYNMSFNGTGAWTSWNVNNIVLNLKEGENKIKAYSVTSDGGPNMDYIEVEKTDLPAVEMVKPSDGRQVENLNRGVSAAYNGSGVMVSWRILATDSENTEFKLYKNGKTPPVYEGTINEASCYFDSSGTASDYYTIDTFVNGEMTEFAQASINLSNKNSGQSGAYFDIPLDKPSGLTMPDGSSCTYSANDASVGDVDGDGEYEIILKWDPSNSQDNSKPGYTGNVYIDCYKMNGKKLWRIDLGKNIRAGAHYTQFMVYDYDGDNKAELVCKTADGTIDGNGKVIGDAYADYRSASGYILSGPEYLTLFDGETGRELHTIDYKPQRDNVSSWGDDYGNRVDRFLAATAYLNGKTPSVVMCRGYYTRMTAVAYDVVNKKLVEKWFFDTGYNSSANGYGDGNHNCMPADVDLDGKDELVMGSAVIDDNGTLLYTSRLGHGDAMHVGDFIPSNPGVEIFMCHENKNVGYGISLRDGKTGKILFRDYGSDDTGRCVAGNLIAGNGVAEMVGSHNSILYTATGQNVCSWSDITKWGMNSVVYWTDTLERAVLDRTMVDQYGKGRVFSGDGVSYNNYSKSNASITCDLFGDWREELVFPANESTVLRVFGTTYTSEYPLYSLMHNTQYRAQVAGQNVAYNQPPHTDYFIETGMPLPVVPEVYAVK